MNITKPIIRTVQALSIAALLSYAVQLVFHLVSFSAYFTHKNPALIYNPSLNLNALFGVTPLSFNLTMACVLLISILHLWIWFSLVLVVFNINLNLPFSQQISGTLQKVSILFVFIWIIYCCLLMLIDRIETAEKVHFGPVYSFHPYLLVAGFVFILSIIFKQGYQSQQDNQLTI